ncbi:MAG: hypothetical protein GXO71_06370 [Caldiserica bacterium]|nr:hypothetical protein [Caldisericota bacterium]
MRRNLLLTAILLLSGIVLSEPSLEIQKLSEQGKVKEAIAKYHDYYLARGKHNPELIEEILYGFLRNTDPKYGYATRRDAAAVLVDEVVRGKRKKEEVISLFKENLKFPDTGVKVNAAKFLILLGYRKSDLLPVLKEGLYKGNVAVSMDAASLLPAIKGEANLPLLKEAMGSNNPLVAIAAVKGLGEMGGEEAKKLLIKGLKYGGGKSKAGEASLKGVPLSGFMSFYTPGQVRIACAQELGKFSGDEVVRALGETLKSSDKNLKIYALKSLGEIAKREKAPQKKSFWLRKRRNALFYIKGALKDEDLKAFAYNVLADLGKEEGINYYRSKLKSDNQQEKMQALSVLTQIKDETAFQYLAEALSSSSAKTRKQAVYLLLPYGKKALPLLDKACGDPSPEVRLAVVKTAGKMGEEGKIILEKLAQDSNFGVQREAIFALSGLSLTGNWSTDLILEEGLFGLKFSRKQLAQLQDREKIINSVKRQINRADKYTRVELAEVLLSLGERQVSIPILRKALSYKRAPRYQKKAAYALSSIGDVSALPLLQKRFFEYGYMEVGTVKALLNLAKLPPSAQIGGKTAPPVKKAESTIKTIKARTPVYAGNNIITQLEPGTQVRFVKKQGAWCLVEFDRNGEKKMGWVKEENLQ